MLNRIFRSRYADRKARPLKGFPRWDMKKWMLKAGAKIGYCGWCGNKIPLYSIGGGTEINPDGTATIRPFNGRCIACGRDPYEFMDDWIYYAEYRDGCHFIKYADGSLKSGGPKHAPHESFIPGDVPVFEM